MFLNGIIYVFLDTYDESILIDRRFNMDVAKLSMNIGSVSAGVQAQTSILKMAMDVPAMAVDSLLNNLQGLEEELSCMITSGLGQNIDVYG